MGTPETESTIDGTASRPQKRLSLWPLVAICVGYFMVILDTMVVNVALPALSKSLHTSTSGLQWIVDAYSLVFGALLLSAGALGDRRGAKAVFQVGMAIFAVSSLACGLAPTTGLLIAARCAQGLGAALAVPSSLSLLQAAYPDRAARRRAFGIWGAVAGIAAGAGPVVGGALVSGLGWRSVFFVNVPIGIAGLALAARFLPSPPRRPHGTDVAGQLAGVASLAGLTVALIEAGASSWASPVVAAGLAVFVVAGAAFVVIEHRVGDPMLALGLFSSPTFSSATAVGLCINLGFYGELFVMSLYLQDLRGFTPLRAGVALTPELAMAVIGSAASGRITARTGPRLPMLVGLVVGAAGLAGLAVAGAHSSYWLLVAPFMAAGLGMSLVMPAATTAVMEAAPPERGGIASGTLNAARQVGGVIGRHLVPLLVDGGHDVAGMTRTPGKADWLRHVGAEPVLCDVFDRDALFRTVASFSPDVVVHQLTGLPDDAAQVREQAAANSRMRREGTTNLVDAACTCGARVIAQSVAWSLPGDGGGAVAFLERTALGAGGVVLRYGQFFGPGTYHPITPPAPPRIHIDEAARRTVTLLEAPSGIVDIVDDPG